MTDWLLDTNVLSAFAPGRRAIRPETAAWFEARTDELFLSAITAAEIEAGVAKLRRTGAARKAEELAEWFEQILSGYSDRVLSFDLSAARIAGVLGDRAAGEGRHPDFADVAIAAIAKSRNLVILTVNRRHFEPLRVDALDPFDPN